jgi:hypothetical protein
MSSELQNTVVESQQGQQLQNNNLHGQSMLPAVVESVLGNLGSQSFHNFKGDQLQVWQQISKATGPDNISADQVLGKEIRLTSFYCHQIHVAGATPGEYVPAVRVVLIDTDRQGYAFASEGVAQDLARIIGAFGMGPYVPPISIMVKQFRTRMGRNAYSIQPYEKP